MRCTIFLAEWRHGAHMPTVADILGMRFGQSNTRLVAGGRRGLFGLATLRTGDTSLLCLRLRAPRSRKAVEEALLASQAFGQDAELLTLTGLRLYPVHDDQLFRTGLLPFLRTRAQHELFLTLEAGFLAGHAFAFAPSGGNRSLFGRDAPL
jgi:hypothetical protein